MDANRFDAMTRTLIGAAPSRRRLLTGVAGSALGTIAAALGLAGVGANHFGCRHVGVHCKRSGQCCSGRCRGPEGKKRCRAHDVGLCTQGQDFCIDGTGATTRCHATNEFCFCFVTTGAAEFCADYAAGLICTDCQKDKDCVAAGFPAGSACVETPGACGCTNTPPRACAAPCSG
jgi:hypothetical protein